MTPQRQTTCATSMALGPATTTLLSLAGVIFVAKPSCCIAAVREFKVENDQFIKDGQPFTIHSGSLHYPRVPPAYWRDRMQRMKALGLNCLTTYVMWNFHEEYEGEFRFAEWRNVSAFLDIAQEEGMLVFMRPGPYVCAEWDLGGLPAWLLMKEGLKLRTYEPQYIGAVSRWWGELLPRLRKHLYSEGGPIIAVQLENEYGYYGDCSRSSEDAMYMHHLLHLARRHLGTKVVFTTVDAGGSFSTAGSPFQGDPRVLGTIDGPLMKNYTLYFMSQKQFNAPGNSPKMWTELWTNWYTSWGHGRSASTMDGAMWYRDVSEMVRENASFSIYMAHGGTSFGFWSGAKADDLGKDYWPVTTSYDYGAPISEAGDHNMGVRVAGDDLFVSIKNALGSGSSPVLAEPDAIKKVSYGWIALPEAAPLFVNVNILATCKQSWDGRADSKLPSMESLRQGHGLLLYRYDAEHNGRFQASVKVYHEHEIHDRAQVFVDGLQAGLLYRPELPTRISLPPGESMDILVENMGRVNAGKSAGSDHKGWLADPPIPGVWTAICIPLDTEQVRSVKFSTGVVTNTLGPVFRRGFFNVSGEPQDTFISTTGLTKGYMWINGFNLGRYWETAGPQHTLYLPAPLLKMGANEIIILELHHSRAIGGVRSVDKFVFK